MSGAGVAQLRKFILNYYYDEDEYIFEAESVNQIFHVLAPYFEYYTTSEDSQQRNRFKQIKEMVTHKGWIPKSLSVII